MDEAHPRDLAASIEGLSCSLPRPSGLTLRRFTFEDRQWLASLLKINSVPEYDHLQMADILWMIDQVHPATMVVGLRHGSPVAILAARPSGPYLHLLFMDVEPTQQRQGIGAFLLRGLQAHAAKVHRSIIAEVYTGNGSALRFYLRYAFEIVGRIPDYYEQGLDAHAIQWDSPLV